MTSHTLRGSENHLAILSEEDVHKIRYLLEQRDKVRKLAAGLTLEAIGRRCGVGKNAVYHIDKGNSWKHLQKERPT